MTSWKNKLDITMHVQISLHHAMSVQYIVMVEENQLHYFNHTAIISLAWPDPIFAQGIYHLQYKRPCKKGLEQFTAATGTATIAV